MGDWVYFSFYNKKNLSGYNCTNYKIPSNVFYNLLKENKKDYLKLFSSRPEQIMNYLDKIDRVEKENGDDLNKFICTFMNLDSLDNEEYFYVICIPFIIKKKYSNTDSDIVVVVTKNKNDKGNKLSYFNIQSLKSGFGLIRKIDPSVDTNFVDMLLCKFNLNKEMGEILEVKNGIIRPNCDMYATNIPSEILYDCKSYKIEITIFDILEHKSLINIINYKDKELVEFVKTIQRDCGEDDINLKFKINLDYYGINNTHVIIQFIASNVNMNNTFENYEYTMSVFKENKSEGVRGYSKCIINNKKISYNQFSEELRDILIA
jgi:hypothetical protein